MTTKWKVCHGAHDKVNFVGVEDGVSFSSGMPHVETFDSRTDAAARAFEVGGVFEEWTFGRTYSPGEFAVFRGSLYEAVKEAGTPELFSDDELESFELKVPSRSPSWLLIKSGLVSEE